MGITLPKVSLIWLPPPVSHASAPCIATVPYYSQSQGCTIVYWAHMTSAPSLLSNLQDPLAHTYIVVIPMIYSMHRCTLRYGCTPGSFPSPFHMLLPLDYHISFFFHSWFSSVCNVVVNCRNTNELLLQFWFAQCRMQTETLQYCTFMDMHDGLI